jgi:hypothetical protein
MTYLIENPEEILIVTGDKLFCKGTGKRHLHAFNFSSKQ